MTFSVAEVLDQTQAILSTPSSSSNLYSPVALPVPSPSPSPSPAISSSNPPFTSYLAERQQKAWQVLIQAYGEAHLRKHPAWEWAGDNWLPHYSYQPVTQISEIWDEWSIGLNGFLPTRELEERWGAKWRRNNPGLKTENGRRKKVIQLVEDLSRKPGWSIKLALRFLQDRYEGTFKSPRKFCEYLQAKKNIGYQEVLTAANTYP